MDFKSVNFVLFFFSIDPTQVPKSVKYNIQLPKQINEFCVNLKQLLKGRFNILI